MDIPTQDELVGCIELFCRRHDIAQTRFGRDAVNNPALLRQLREGKSPTLDTLNKVKAFMAEMDSAAATRAKLDAPLDPPAIDDAGEDELPFVPAPVNPTGASSPTSSPTTAPRQQSGASGSCPSSSEAEAA